MAGRSGSKDHDRMRSVRLNRLWPAMAVAAALAGAAAPTIASADVLWTVNGTFDDGGALTGTFEVDQYGYLIDAALTTSAWTVDDITRPAFTYTLINSFIATGVDLDNYYVDFQPGYQADLHVQFTDPLKAPEADNVIIGGEQGPSYECKDSFSCFVPAYGPTRYLDGFASSRGTAVPEPAAWALMIVGFGMAGGLLRARRRTALA
jgi:hypothetical protein